MPIFASYAYAGGAEVTGLLFLRFFCTALLLFSYLLVMKAPLAVRKKQLFSLFLLGGILYMLQSTFYFTAVKFIPASLAALLLYTFPIFVLLLAFLVDREKITGSNIGAALLSVAGLALVLGAGFGEIKTAGVLLAIGAAVTYSCYVVFSSKVLKETTPLVSTAYIALFAAVSLFLVGVSTDGLQLQYGRQVWMSLAGIVVLSTIFPMITLFIGLNLIGSTKASIISMVEPIITIGFSAVLLGERLTWLQICGVVAVLAGAFLVVANRRPTEAVQVEESQ